MFEKRKQKKETEKGSASQSIIKYLFKRAIKWVPPSAVYLQSLITRNKSNILQFILNETEKSQIMRAQNLLARQIVGDHIGFFSLKVEKCEEKKSIFDDDDDDVLRLE